MQKNFPYYIHPQFVVRSPLYPLDSLITGSEDADSQREFIKSLCRDSIFMEGIYLASPGFYKQIMIWLNGKVLNRKDEERIFETIYKYFSRMASRCTPFGLFAGCGVGKIGEVTEVIIEKETEHTRHTRLDMLYLCNLVNNLAKKGSIKNQIRFFPNNTIYEAGSKIRYIESRINKDSRTYNLVEVKSISPLKKILKLAEKGKTISELNGYLNKKYTLKQKKDFIDSLIENQILISELDPTVTGEEFLLRLLRIVSTLKNNSNLKILLNRVDEKINKIDIKIGNPVNKYLNIVTELKKLKIEFNDNFLFQTDVNLRFLKCTVNKNILDSIIEGISFLNKMSSRQNINNIYQFKEAFVKRYETRECQLLKVLDTESGIGYLQSGRNLEGDITPLVSDLVVPIADDDRIKVDLSTGQIFIFNKMLEALSAGKLEIEILENEINSFISGWDSFPSSFSCMVKIIENGSNKYPSGRILIEGVGGNSALELLGRFCHGNKEIHKLVNNIAENEQRILNNAIIAEIVHLPESRLGNIMLRPVINKFEIPFLTLPAVDKDHTIPLSDLYISVRNNELILRSKRFNKRIIPRLSNAHNYSIRALPAYQFLCDLQSQNLRSFLGLNLGEIQNGFSFIPRIIYKNLILNPASWVIKQEEIKKFLSLKDDTELNRLIYEWRMLRKIPEYVLLENGDNKYLVNFNKAISIRVLMSLIKSAKHFILKEFLFDFNNAVIKGKHGVYTNEFVFTFIRNQ